jgi:hypothetical protein
MRVEIWGTVAAWFSAIGTSGAAVAAATYYIVDSLRANRRQAQLITCWIVDGPSNSIVHVVNYSNEPVFYLMLEFMSISTRRARKTKKELLMSKHPDDPAHFKYFHVKWLYEISHDIDFAPGASKEIEHEFEYDPSYYEVTIYFNDAHGRKWYKDVNTSKFKGLVYGRRSVRRQLQVQA